MELQAATKGAYGDKLWHPPRSGREKAGERGERGRGKEWGEVETGGWTLQEIALKVEVSNKTPSIEGCVRCDGCCGIKQILI
jgi:hypothetical protein